MITLDRPVVVEGRYDKCKLSSFLDATILTTGGFDIFKDSLKMNLIRELARDKGVILLTDSDVAGFRIRNYLRSALGDDKIIHVYIPDVFGKESRKAAPSKEGKLGVEGISREGLLEAFRRAGIVCGEEQGDAPVSLPTLTKVDLYECGLSGKPDSAARRRKLLSFLGLPERIGTNALLRVLSHSYTKEQLYLLADELTKN